MKNNFVYIPVILIFFLAGCSNKSSKELWYEAVDLQKNNELEQAVSTYEKIAEKYPESEEAPKALFEAAKLYQCKSFKNLSDKELCSKAVELYHRIYEKYPDSNESPKALFMTAFIQSNELNDFEKARQIYQLFLTKYPDHEMAASAQAEVDNMGLTPEEIIRGNVQVKNNGRNLPGL